MSYIIKKEDLDENNVLRTGSGTIEFPPMTEDQDGWILSGDRQIMASPLAKAIQLQEDANKHAEITHAPPPGFSDEVMEITKNWSQESVTAVFENGSVRFINSADE